MTSATESTKISVGVLIENQFNDLEFKIPVTALKNAGARVTVLGSRMNDEYKSALGKISVKPDATMTEVCAQDFDALVIPGGSIRRNPNAIHLVMDTMIQGKWIATVGYGLQVLIEADQLQQRKVTGCLAIRKDIENAGATFLNAPTIVDEHLISARRPSDLPIFTTSLLRELGLSIKGMKLPESSIPTYEWWEIGEVWGGSSRQEIIEALNTAIVGERYTLEAFKQYSYRVTDQNLRMLLQEISRLKQYHIQQLEDRLHKTFHHELSWKALGSEAFAALRSLLQSGDEISVLRHALGDLQTGVIDTYRLCNQLTDPVTVNMLEAIENDLARYEQRLAIFYRNRAGDHLQPPIPTTMVAMH